jgi:hypothetical protein
VIAYTDAAGIRGAEINLACIFMRGQKKDRKESLKQNRIKLSRFLSVLILT